MTVINYDGKNTHRVRAARHTDDGVERAECLFVPGANEVPQDEWEFLQEHSKACRRMVKHGQLKVVTASPDSEDGPTGDDDDQDDAPLGTLDDADVGKMDAWSAIALVKSVVDLKHLKRFRVSEELRDKGGRKTVAAALDEQIAAVEQADEKKKEK